MEFWGACAIPVILSTRTISNWKERLITILVTPLISCSARIPVFAVLIAFIIPSKRVLGIFNSQGLLFMALYATGVVAALVSAWIFKKIIKSEEYSFLMLELPSYKVPHWKNVFTTVWDKIRSFIWGAGKTILVISIVLWALASFGPSSTMEAAHDKAITEAQMQKLTPEATNHLAAAYKIEASYASIMGRAIEPAIRPLGFDWKIGIALITSFAAREVFVGTLATIYSVGDTENTSTLQARMHREMNRVTGKPVYSMATALSLVVFYLFAMQCVSTIVVVYRETKTWKWPLVQVLYMSGLAYLASFLVYTIFQ